MAITQTITALPAAPDPASDTPASFSTKATAFVLAQKAEVAELNAWATQANALAAAMTAVAAGGAVSLQYTFDTTTTDADPGAGKLRLSSATQNASTVIRASNTGSDGSALSTVLDLLDDSTSTNKGYLTLRKATDSTKWLVFTIASEAAPSGYHNITVTNVASSAASPFALNDPLLLDFTPTGDKGAIGNTGATGPAGADGATVGVTAGKAVQVDQAVTAWTRAATTTLGTSLNGTLSDTSTTITAFNGVAGVTYHCRALGAGSITHHATNLIITQTSASIITAAGDTFDVEMLTATTCRVKNYERASGQALAATSASVGDHSVVVNTGNGWGSTNTTIRRFTTTQSSTGTAITYADSATLGATFTINTAGIYAITHVDSPTGAANTIGVSINSNQLTTNINGITAANRLVMTVQEGAARNTAVSTVVLCAVNDVIRPHGAGNAMTEGAANMFSIRLIGL